jgi:hypothetical protein
MQALFTWHTFDVRSILPANWDSRILAVANESSRVRALRPPHVTSRENSSVKELIIRGVSAAVVAEKLPWIVDLYRQEFLELAQSINAEPVSVAHGAKHTVVLNVHHADGTRYECHVDTNPIQGLLYVTSQPEGTGGELVVANNRSAASLEEIDADSSIIYPQQGHLLFFDARFYPHYIRELLRPGDVRVAVAMNYYVPSCPETVRPADLDDYLYGTILS